jgi:hypothetical protein
MTVHDRRCAIAVALLIAFGANRASAQVPPSDKSFPDILSAKVRIAGPGRFDFDVTISSLYDTPKRYADAFRVKGGDGTVYGERILLHDHQYEQPFTRDLYGVAIPAGVRVVIVEGRDQKNGWGGRTIEVALPGR